MRAQWERLHDQPRFRPIWPAESVVRFVSARGSADQLCLDVGAGAGRHSALVRSFGMRVISVDLSVTGLTHAVLTVDRPLMVAASVDRLPLTAESVDMVVCFGVLYYLPLPKLQRAIEEIRRVLRPGGSALVVTRTTRDYRYSTGVVIDDHHVIVTQHTGEQGIAQTFLTEDDLSSLFGSFPSVTMNYNDFTLGEESNLNSDWVIQVTR